jgi:hypothetical protein
MNPKPVHRRADRFYCMRFAVRFRRRLSCIWPCCNPSVGTPLPYGRGAGPGTIAHCTDATVRESESLVAMVSAAG